jgi:hypothetical protein
VSAEKNSAEYTHRVRTGITDLLLRTLNLIDVQTVFARQVGGNRGRIIYFTHTPHKYVSGVPVLASWNEFARTPLEASLDGPITRAAYRRYMRSR